VKKNYTLLLTFLLSGCASFYELNYEFNRSFEDGNILDAKNVLDANKRAEKSKTRFLYFANQGVVNHLLGNYEESNKWLEEAYIFGEDHRVNYLNFAGSYFLNPSLIVYPGEDHEHLMLLYYKALNFLKMNNYDAALIECRRLNQRLYELGDKYTSERKYQRDAFIHNLMGIIYEASMDYNNAFIAYRNSLEIYETDYKELFQLGAPTQLKKDLLRTAYLAGFPEELDKYESEFGILHEKEQSSGGSLVFFWHNGLSPIKDQWAISFVTSGEAGYVTFFNEDLGIDFSFQYDELVDRPSINDLSGTKIAFPKYVERPPYFRSANLLLNNRVFDFEIAQDLNSIAFKTLNERMLAELGKGLLRVALKKVVEKQVRKENETLGFLVSAINFASEQADTRNWQTLPHGIHYSRIPLMEGQNKISFRTSSPSDEKIEEFNFIGIKGKTQFHTYQSLESDIAF